MSGGRLENFSEFMFREWSEQMEGDSPAFSRIVYDMGDLLHIYDYWRSGDMDEEDFLEVWGKFCKKWNINEPDNLEEKVWNEL